MNVITTNLAADEGDGEPLDGALYKLPPDALQALDELWGGSDSISSAALEGLMPEDRRAPLAVGRRDLLPKLQMLGAFDSGTNLLRELLVANLRYESLREYCPWHGEGHCWFSKHSPPRNLDYHVERLRKEGSSVVLVAMVRSPLAHIAGWIKAPYNFAKCIHSTNWTDYHEHPCNLEGVDDEGLGQENFSGPTGVWNRHTQGYDKYSGGAYPGVLGLIIEYERLVFEPEGVVREVADALGIQLSSPFRSIDAPAKAHGDPHGREKAMKEIQEMRYLQREPMSNSLARAGVCAHLDAAAMGRHVMPTVPSRRSYADDCWR
jgi:hypothetical protein